MATELRHNHAVGSSAAQAAVPQSKLDAAVEETMRRQTVEWTVGESGEKMSASISTVRKLFANPTKNGHAPSDKDCWLFLQLCKARGLNPYVGDAFLVGYDAKDGPKFNLITSHQALLKRAELSGHKDGMESGVTLLDKSTGEIVDWPGDFYLEDRHTLVGGWCRVYRKDQKIPIYDRLKLATFNKGISLWSTNPAGMIVKCAEASAHRLAFPIETQGLYLREEFAGREETSPSQGQRVSGLDALANRLKFQAVGQATEPAVEPDHEADVQPEPADYDPLQAFFDDLYDCSTINAVRDHVKRFQAAHGSNGEWMDQADRAAEYRIEEIRATRGERANS